MQWCIHTDGKKKETDLAVLVIVDGNEIWLPKSQIEDHDEDYVDIVIPEWLVMENGLEDYGEASE